MTTIRVVLHPEAIKQYGRSPGVHTLLGDIVGPAIAEDAAAMAPKRTGAGAASIHSELVEDASGPVVRVSWDKAHFYMGFAELGTSRQSATPFLRPAAERHRSI